MYLNLGIYLFMFEYTKENIIACLQVSKQLDVEVEINKNSIKIIKIL